MCCGWKLCGIEVELNCVGLCENVLGCVGLCGIGEVGGMAWGSTACLSQHGLLMSVGGKYSRMIMFFPCFLGGLCYEKNMTKTATGVCKPSQCGSAAILFTEAIYLSKSNINHSSRNAPSDCFSCWRSVANTYLWERECVREGSGKIQIQKFKNPNRQIQKYTNTYTQMWGKHLSAREGSRKSSFTSCSVVNHNRVGE